MKEAAEVLFGCGIVFIVVTLYNLKLTCSSHLHVALNYDQIIVKLYLEWVQIIILITNYCS